MVAIGNMPPSHDLDLGHFEGQEKRLQLQICGGTAGLRSLGRDEWSQALSVAKCTIVSMEINDLCDAFVLSESSLFVYDDGILVKTCGTTSLLHMLPHLVEIIYGFGAKVAHVRFTHSQLLFPTEQHFPHKAFDSEVEFLQRFFPEGEAFCLGRCGTEHHVFVANYIDTPDAPLSRPFIELIMTELDPAAMKSFFNETGTVTASTMRHESGIAAVLPQGCRIDDQSFVPCGYSANALAGAGLVTIHVTPEDHCSFVSFETSAFEGDCTAYVARIADVFKPRLLSVVLSANGPLPAPTYFGGYQMEDVCRASQGKTTFKKMSFRRAEANPQANEMCAIPAVHAKSAKLCRGPLRAIPTTFIEDMISLVGDEFKMQDLRSVDSAVEYKIKEVGEEDPFYLVDLGVVARQYQKWVQCLPRVRPHYAVKAAPDPAMVKLLHMLGAGFDCASKAEIDLVKAVGVPSDSIIYANPCKLKSHLRFAKHQGVTRMTFDSEAELYKISEIYPEAEIVLRVVTDDSNSICRFSNKFGVELGDCRALICKAMELDLNIVGVSFHVGSGCQDTDSFIDALHRAKSVFGQMQSLGLSPWLLDIGGGFPGTDDEAVTFEQIAAVIGPVIDQLFDPSIAVIAEPGRFFCAASHTLVANMYARRAVVGGDIATTEDLSVGSVADDDETKAGYLYYMNDGVYGSFNCIFFDHAVISKYRVHDPTTGRVVTDRPQYKSTVFGPTCDGLDTVLKDIELPLVEVGDWLSFPNMGAYTRAASSNFNGMHQHSIHYIRA